MGLGYPKSLVDLIDQRIAAARVLSRKTGTFIEISGGYAMVAFDGSSTAMPCLYLANVNLTPNARVVVDMYGSDWVVTGAFKSTSPWPISTFDFTVQNSITSSTPSNGSPVVEIQFDAPPSGGVYLSVAGQITQANVGNLTVLSYRVVQGKDWASGTEIQPYDARRGIVAGRAVISGGAPEMTATHRWPLTGLVPGQHYVARTGHWVSPAGTGSAIARFLMAEPVV